MIPKTINRKRITAKILSRNGTRIFCKTSAGNGILPIIIISSRIMTTIARKARKYKFFIKFHLQNVFVKLYKFFYKEIFENAKGVVR